ncbi:MAG: sigma-70 family RNA polymerase sigma factor [Mariprofundaceae bacterium]|nr:sigma-70 family RNA polymerase sigma factor [Mariprofundaceae bacterium]
MKNNMPTQPENWLNEHGDFLYRYAFSQFQDADQAADLVQETLLGAWRNYHNFQGDSSERTWLMGIMKHKVLDLIRKRIKERSVFSTNIDPLDAYFHQNNAWKEQPQAWYEQPEEAASNEDLAKILHQCIRSLPQVQRDVFSLKEIQDESTQTICQSCDISTTNFHVLMHRARLALRVCLTKHWKEET